MITNNKRADKRAEEKSGKGKKTGDKMEKN